MGCLATFLDMTYEIVKDTDAQLPDNWDSSSNKSSVQEQSLDDG